MMNKTIPVFDEAGNYIKDVFPRYAIQRVLKGQARLDAWGSLRVAFTYRSSFSKTDVI